MLDGSDAIARLALLSLINTSPAHHGCVDPQRPACGVASVFEHAACGCADGAETFQAPLRARFQSDPVMGILRHADDEFTLARLNSLRLHGHTISDGRRRHAIND